MGLGLLTSAIGLLTLIGWLFDFEGLKRVHPHSPVMHPDTALAFVLAGISLYATHAGRFKIAHAGACAVLALGALPLLADEAGSGLYLSLWRLASGQAGDSAEWGTHMSTLSSVEFLLAGLGLASIGKGRAFPLAQIAALGILATALFALISYAYDVPSFYAVLSSRIMSMHSAFAFAVLGTGLLFAEPRRGFAAVILSEWAGGILLRRLLPYVIAVPALVGWLRLRGEYAGLYGTNAGLAIFAMANISILAILLYRSGCLLNRKDLALRESEVRASEIIENSVDGIVTANTEGIIETFNAAASRMFGYMPVEAIGKNVSILMPEPYRSEHDRYIREYLQTGSGRIIRQGQRSELPAVRRNGNGFPVELVLSEVISEEKHYFIALMHDISERVRAQSALVASEKWLRAIIDAEPACIKILDADGMLLDINPAGLAMLEADSMEQLNENEQGCHGFVALDQQAAFRAFLASAWRGDTANLEFEITGLKGTRRWLDAVAVLLPFDDANRRPLLFIARDISARYLAEQARRTSEARYRRIFESNMLGIGCWNIGGGITEANDKLLEIVGYTRAEMLAGQLDWIAITPPEYRHLDMEAYQSILSHGVFSPFEKEYIHKDGHRIPILVGAAAFEDDKNSGVFFILDITARKLAEAQLKKLSLAVEHSPNAVVITDANAKIEYVNPKFEQLTGYALEEVVGHTPRILKSGLTPEETYQSLWKSILNGEEWHGEFHDRKKNGQIYWCLQSISPLKNERGEITHFVSVTEDISERKHSEAVIRHLAYYDPLTDLPNRTLFRDRLEQAIALAQRNERLFALMYLDLDRFKNINDTLGHPMGDLLLKAVAERMREGLRDSDTVARLGGDEFAVIVQDIHCTQDALRLAEHLLGAFTEPFLLEGHELFITPSIGIGAD